MNYISILIGVLTLWKEEEKEHGKFLLKLKAAD
jgi:hypothetical protein